MAKPSSLNGTHALGAALKRAPWALVVLVAIGLAIASAGFALSSGKRASPADHGTTNLGAGIDDVTLLDEAGAPIAWSSLRGRPRVLFFGFTHCPVICPVTVYELTAAMERIGPGADNLAVEFVTLDPARDTPEVLRAYFKGFGGKVHGFSGEEASIARVAKAYEVTYRKSEEANGEYSLDHTATAFLISPSGAVVDVIGYGSPPETIEKRLRALLAGS
jgi:protein SCO1